MVNRPYTGPSIPTAYDPGWQTYTNLTQEQIAAFQSFPEDLLKYLALKRWQKGISGTTWRGITIDTQDADISLITTMAMAATRDPTGKFSFTQNGMAYSLTAAEVLNLFDTVNASYQNLRNAEAQLIKDIHDKKVTTRSHIDKTIG